MSIAKNANLNFYDCFIPSRVATKNGTRNFHLLNLGEEISKRITFLIALM